MARGSVGTGSPSSSTERTATTRSTPSAWTWSVVTSPRRTTLASSSCAARSASTDPAAVHARWQVGLQLDDGADLLAGGVELDLQRLVQRIGGVGEHRHAVGPGSDAVPPRPLAAGLLERPQQAGIDAATIARGRRAAAANSAARSSAAPARSSAAIVAAAACSASSRAIARPASASSALAASATARSSAAARVGGRRLQRRRGAGQLGGLLARARLGRRGEPALGAESRPGDERDHDPHHAHDAEDHRQHDHRFDPSDTAPTDRGSRAIGRSADDVLLDPRRHLGRQHQLDHRPATVRAGQ